MHRIFFRLGNSCIIHLSSHSIQLFGAIRGPNSSTWGSLTRPRQCDGDLGKSSRKGCQPPRGARQPSGCFNQPEGLAGELASLLADPREGGLRLQKPASPFSGCLPGCWRQPLRRGPGYSANRDPPLGTASGSQVESEGLAGELIILPADPERGACRWPCCRRGHRPLFSWGTIY